MNKGNPELDENGQPKLTYAYLASLAVTPAADHEDLNISEVHGLDGAYHNSPLGMDIGLHIHAPSDRWYETEAAHPVHFVMNGSKIAEVYPFGIVNRERQNLGENWREEMLSWGESERSRVAMLDRLIRDAGPEINHDEAVLRESP